VSVRIFWHPTSREHDTGRGHPESPARIDAVLAGLHASAAAEHFAFIEADPAPDDALLRAHAESHIRNLEALDAEGGGRLDSETVLSPASWEAARRGAGAAVAAARSALDGTPAFAAVRPPGHHATRHRAMGFCLLNSVAIAAYTAIAEVGLERVLIVDWDVHHGNGTQDIVERDPRVRYVSLHEWPLYPGTGRADERGVGNVFNLPMPAGLDRAVYVDALREGVERAVDGWAPQLVLVSAGFDALAGDPLAGFTLEPEDYAAWITAWRGLAPLASVLEGGYVPSRIATAAEAHVRAMLPGVA
jgi:acetoin utilization deacetylase AcuC-like enzyme